MKKKIKPARNKQEDTLPFVQCAIKGIEEKKGAEIVCLDLKKISNSPSDYFVICEGTSRTHVQAIAGSVEEFLKKEMGRRPWHVEGLQNAEWVLMDYVDFVVHIFQPEFRLHFSLEDMWADAEVKDLSSKITPPAHTAAERKKTAGTVVKKKKAAVKKIAKKGTKPKKAVAKKTIKKKVKSKSKRK